MNAKEIEAVIDQILTSKKYRLMHIPRETIADLLSNELKRHKKRGDAIQAVKTKLHNIMAPYLDKLDYLNAMQSLDDIFSGKSDKSTADICIEILQAHDSTRERLPYLSDFYGYIFDKVGSGGSILDLACGLNPFSIPLVNFSTEAAFFAYDIHQPRIILIKRLFRSFGIRGDAECRDILVRPPNQEAKAAFLFKEAHRIEKRQPGASRNLLRSLNVTYTFLSLPTHSLNGRHDLRKRMDTLVKKIIAGIGDLIESIQFPSETVYTIRMKHGEEKD